MDIETARFNMIEQQIRPWNVLDQAVLSLLATVRREDFLPPALRALAFVDTQVPLEKSPVHLTTSITTTAAGTADGACMLEPKVEARLLQELQVQRHEKVLEIGTGSGFMAALLAHRGQWVFSLECRPALAAIARSSLARNGVANVSVLDVDVQAGTRGLPAEAPFDVVLLSGSVFEVPQGLLAQLKVGGRLAAVVGNEPVMQARLYTRASETAWSQADLFDTVAPRLEGFGEPSRFRF